MAGTDHQRKISSFNKLKPPVIILVGPQLGENIGMCARAMLNCAVTELRLVNPRDGWPNPDATAAASGAIPVLEGAKVYPSTADAIADLTYVLATTARSRDLAKPVYTPQEGAQVLHVQHQKSTEKCGILFGPERTGLENDDVALADAILNVPLNPSFSSLNLSQAVLLVCHAWLSTDNPFSLTTSGITESAPKNEIETLMLHLEEALIEGGFFRSPDQRPTLMRNIRSFFFRSTPTSQEIRTLYGVFSCLMGKRSIK